MITKSIKSIFLSLFLLLPVNFFGFIGIQAVELEASNQCLNCHDSMQSGLSPAHRFGKYQCVSCHLGDASTNEKEKAHVELIAFPGNLSNADQACGQCHPRQVSGIQENSMHRAPGMVSVTRFVFNEQAIPEGQQSLQSLKHSPADSLLRKLCASCHLGQEKQHHAVNPTFDRGGGCLACHLNEQSRNQHPGLSSRVEDGRCFGCHSRSGRIALNYAGLAEVNLETVTARQRLARLQDGRLVEHKPADIHQQAGMACIDCHTSTTLMGSQAASAHTAVDINCTDCHDNQQGRITLEEFPEEFEFFKSRIPFKVTPGQQFLTTKSRSTPLWSIELHDEQLILHRKIAGQVLLIPRLTAQNHPLQNKEHQRLDCASCHSQWAPQCTGCHLNYDAEQSQWDHLQQKVTPGRWIERRWGIYNELPSLGVGSNNRIKPFVPGMILSIEHPHWKKARFSRIFGALSPHTTGPSRSCTSCHRSSLALGLGRGNLNLISSSWQFSAERKILDDHLPEDAWTSLTGDSQGQTTQTGDRPFNRVEILRVLNAHITSTSDNNNEDR